MQLTATSFAQFFIQDEYHYVALKQHALTIASNHHEMTIPFTAWDGHITVERGVIWGKLYFHSHEENGEQIQWLVQGLPWQECQNFAYHAIESYQSWYQTKSAAVRAKLPQWTEQLQNLVHQPGYLPQGAISQWQDEIHQTLESLDIRLLDVVHQLPAKAQPFAQWLTEPYQCLDTRNQTWLSKELELWQDYFQQYTASPLNPSQQRAILMNCNHNLILAGAGSGKTSVLCARVGYLLQSGQAQGRDILLLAFGKSAAQEMKRRLQTKFGVRAKDVQVKTFHQLGLEIIREVEALQAANKRKKLQRSQSHEQNEHEEQAVETKVDVTVSPLVTDEKQRHIWISQWLQNHWQTPSNLRRWQTHLSQWPVAYLIGDNELASQVEHQQLLAWIDKQVEQLCSLHLTKKQLQQQLQDQNIDDEERLISELDLVWPCYLAWQKMLKDEKHLDFYTMISRAFAYVQQGKYKPEWGFVMVDEYQDISPQRLDLLEAICEKSRPDSIDPERYFACSLFAVGDDWQAIYRFAGADVNLTTGFQQRFPKANIHALDTTYRFNNKIGEVANRFVMQNPKQLPKTLQSYKHQQQKAITIADTKSFEDILHQLNQEQEKQHGSRPKVLLLGRYNYQKPEKFNQLQQRFSNLELQFVTCHASKGKEAEYVIVLHVDQGMFPAQKRQSHLADMLLTPTETFPDAEERRLFYVSLTRAKQHVWLLHGAHPSPFIKELKKDNYSVKMKKER